MDEYNIKSRVFSSFFWVFAGRIGNQFIQFFIQIILARLLLPSEYGLIAIVLVFIQLANVFIDSGFGTALIQKKDVDDLDFSSVFLLSLLIAIAIYILFFFLAPFIAFYFDESSLIPIIRILSLIFFIGVYNSIQNAIISRNLWFKKTFFSSFLASIISGIFAIIAAYNNLGIWALIIQQLSAKLIVTLILIFQIKWLPSIKFSLSRIIILFNFGSKLLLSTFIDTLYNNFSTLIIGKLYTPEMLAFYNKGQQFPTLVVNEINGSIQSVMFPVFSSFQDDKSRIKSMLQRSIKTSTFLVFPMMVGMAVLADPMIRLLLTEKWIDSVRFLQIFCFIFALWPIHTSNLQAINALGRSDIFLKLEIIKKSIGIVILAISVFYGVYGIIIGRAFSGVVGMFINAFPNTKLLNYKFYEQLKDIFPSLVISLIMGFLVAYINIPESTIIIQLFAKILIGIITYIVLSIITKNDSFIFIKTSIHSFLKK